MNVNTDCSFFGRVCRPIIRPSSKPSIFSIVPLSSSHNTTGAWVVLDLSNNSTFTLPSPRSASIYSELNPRDRYIRQTIDSIAWFFSKRFTVRSSIAANLALDVGMEIMDAEEVLRWGGVEWKAELVDSQPLTVRGEGQSRTGVPNHAVVTSIVPRETAVKAIGLKKEQERVVFNKDENDKPAEILASETIAYNKDETTAPRFPCPKLYLRLSVRESGIPIPCPPSLARMETRAGAVYRVVEWIFGPLATSHGETREEEGEEEGGVRGTAPIHITLERLYFGVIPAVVIGGMGWLLILAVGVGWWGVRPILQAALPKVDKKEKEKDQ